MNYKAIEGGRLKNGHVKYEIEGIVSGDIDDVTNWLRVNVRPGDTCQWIYEHNQTDPFTYEQMLNEWARDDAYNSGKWDGMTEWKGGNQ